MHECYVLITVVIYSLRVLFPSGLYSIQFNASTKKHRNISSIHQISKRCLHSFIPTSAFGAISLVNKPIKAHHQADYPSGDMWRKGEPSADSLVPWKRQFPRRLVHKPSQLCIMATCFAIRMQTVAAMKREKSRYQKSWQETHLCEKQPNHDRNFFCECGDFWEIWNSHANWKCSCKLIKTSAYSVILLIGIHFIQAVIFGGPPDAPPSARKFKGSVQAPQRGLLPQNSTTFFNWTNRDLGTTTSR